MATIQPANAAVVFHELMYHPLSDSLDEEFLELYNTGGTTVDLSGWCISGVDFCFAPGAQILPGDYLVVASDATRFAAVYGFPPDAVYNGQLSNSGELLVLRDASLVVQDEVEFSDGGLWPPTADGLGPSLEVIDATADNATPRNWAASTAGAQHTAGTANSVAASGLPPWITDVAHGTVAASTPLTVTASVVDAASVELFYRLDFGSEVQLPMFDDGAHGDGAASDGVYGATIPGQPVDTLIRYRLVATGPTGVLRHPRADDTITYLGTAIIDPALTSALPIIHWYIDPVDYQEALDHYETDETEPAVVFYNGTLYDNVQIRVRGQTARVWPKKHWKFIFPQGHKFTAPDLIDNSVDRFNLQGNWGDKSHLREVLAYETLAAADMPAPIAFPVRLEQNGQFFGLYTYLEQPESDWTERIGLDPDGARYRAYDFCGKRQLVVLPDFYEKQTRLDEDFSDLRNTLLAPLQDLTGVAKRNHIFDFVDLPRQINYLAALSLIHDNDHLNKNYFLYRDTLGTGRWTMLPWDMDLTFGRNAVEEVLNDTIWANVDSLPGRPNVAPSHPLFGEEEHQKYNFIWNRCIDAFLEQPEVKQMFYRRLATLVDEILVPPVYENRIDALVPLIAPEAELNRLKWGQYGQAQTLTQAVNFLKNLYITPRRQHLAVTHRVPGEIPPPQSAAPPIVIHEVHYNPTAGSDHEFLELYNPSPDEAVDLSGWTIDAVELTFPGGTVILPESYLVVDNDDVAFRAEYGSGLFIPTQLPENLSNGGASLVLRDHLGSEIDRVDYDDVAPWPSTPDGAGPSLELIRPDLDNAVPAHWAASLEPGGTPGAINSVNVVGGPPPELYVNEVVAVNATGITDEMGEPAPWIEIYNPTGASVDLGGMFLTDDAGTPAEWEIPGGTSVCAGCWLTIWADGETGEGPLHTSFALSAGGGNVYLFTDLLVEIDSLSYPALGADAAYGRFPDGSAETALLFAPTPGAANLGPPSPLILNEYNAVSDGNFLGGGGSDIFWGIVMGNGGDWFEMVVTTDHLDIRGWDLVLSNNTGAPNEDIEILTLTNDPIWSDLRSGTIITVSELLADDVSYDPLHGDWWINVQAADAGTGTYITAMNFPVSNDNWQLTILNELDEVVFGPAGEGIGSTSGIGSNEVCKLEEDPGPHITPLSNFNDGNTSTFSGPNAWDDGASVQDFSALRAPVGSVVTSEITSPAGGTVFQDGDDVLIEATAESTNATITGVQFFADAGGGPVLIGSDTEAPYSFLWQDPAPATYVLTTVATDTLAETGTSAGVMIRVNAAPLVTLTSPPGGSVFTLCSLITVSASASDSDGTVTQVQFFADGGGGPVSLGTDTTPPYSVTWDPTVAGSYNLTAVATDNNSATRTSTQVSITVSSATCLLFSDGFQSGSTSAWSATVP